LRATFEIKFLASNLDESKAIAKTRICTFLNIAEKDFDDLVSLELKITNSNSEKTDKDDTPLSLGEGLEVTAYGTLKSNVTKL
jgi:hypothetical protein